jgi:hypothetical protein
MPGTIEGHKTKYWEPKLHIVWASIKRARFEGQALQKDQD